MFIAVSWSLYIFELYFVETSLMIWYELTVTTKFQQKQHSDVKILHNQNGCQFFHINPASRNLPWNFIAMSVSSYQFNLLLTTSKRASVKSHIKFCQTFRLNCFRWSTNPGLRGMDCERTKTLLWCQYNIWQLLQNISQSTKKCWGYYTILYTHMSQKTL